MYNNSVQLILDSILHSNKVTVEKIAINTGLSRQTIYRAISGRGISAKSKHKILQYYCYLQLTHLK